MKTVGIESPCVQQCRLVSGKCQGCGRTREQVRDWLRYTDEQRSDIMNELKQRLTDNNNKD